MKIKSAEFIKSAKVPSQYPPSSFPEVAFAGRSNVGKSTLINVLTNRKKLAATSATPGKTRLINFFVLNGSLGLVDLPGYGFAKVPLETRKEWGPMVESYLRNRPNLKLGNHPYRQPQDAIGRRFAAYGMAQGISGMIIS